MTFQEAEKTYKDLRLAHSAGKVTDADFESQVNQLKVQDANGRWWQLGVRTGEWYYNDGQKWVKGKPPVIPAPVPPAAPASTPAPAATMSTTASAGTAAATADMSAPAPQTPPKEEKTERASVMPRGLFAAKPEGSNGGGLSRPVLIGIIAVVAVVVIAVLVGAYFLVSGAFGGARASATATSTQVAIIAPTSAATFTVATTDTPAPSATLVVTATNTVTATVASVRATSTRGTVIARTATPTKAITATATIPPPPGLYVTKIAIDRTIEANQKFGFLVTFVNSTSGPAHQDKWLVVVFRKKDLVEGSPEKPFGQSPVKTLDVPVGKSDVLLSEAYALGPAGEPDCHYLAEANYIGDNNNLVPFPSTGAKPIRFEFSFCQ